MKSYIAFGTVYKPKIPILESGEERYVYGNLNAGILESAAPILNT
jgi:hypothetical protein